MRLNQTSFRPGEMLRMDVTLKNPGPMLTADVYVGAQLPTGDVLWMTDLSSKAGVVTRWNEPTRFAPALRGVNWPANLDAVQTDFLTHRWSGGEEAGSYVLLVAWVKPRALEDGSIDAGDVLAVAWEEVSFQIGQGRQNIASR